MPFDIQPIIDTSVAGRGSYNLDPGGDWSWLRKQEYRPDRAAAAIGYHTRGAIGGGPTFKQFLEADDPKQFTHIAQPPPLTTDILQGLSNASGGKKIGQLNLDLIDPFGSMSQASGSFLGQDEPAVGTGGHFDPGAFLASKGIDIFGRNDVGVPARLTDYALALPIAVLNKIRGVHSEEPTANPSGVSYRFQSDPGYWQLLDAAKSDDELRAVASAVASKYIDPSRNQYLVQQLFDVMKKDRDVMLTAQSSGNDRIDYVAKWAFANELANGVSAEEVTAHGAFFGAFTGRNLAATAVRGAGVAANVVTAIPFVGPAIASGIAPIDPGLEAAWKGLSAEQRRNYFAQAGFTGAVVDLTTQLPMLAGLGSVLAVAKGSEGIAATLYKGYDTTLRTTSFLMGTGLVVATSNWALEAAVPGYSEYLGKEIDYARPISKSSLAGVVNELGFWSSGSFGVVPAIQVALKVEGKVAGVAAKGLSGLHVHVPEFGPQELAFFHEYGGSQVRAELQGAGLTGIDTSVKASFMSHLMNWVERTRLDPIEAAARGETTPWEHVNAMDPQQRLEWANDQLARGMLDGPEVAESFVRLLAYARRPKPINPSEEVRAAWQRAHDIGKTIDEQLGADVAHQYGPDFISNRRLVGSYLRDDMEKWAREKVTELGGDGDKLGKHDEDGWARIIRTLHQHEYHHVNGELQAAIETEATAEAGKIAVIASDHLFAQDVDRIEAELNAGDAAANAKTIGEAIRSSREAREWFSTQYKPRPGAAKVPENVPPAVFRAWLRDARPALPNRRVNAPKGSDTVLRPINALQTKLDEQGTWTLAFKPVDADGNFVSYARTSSGGLLRSPWVEYPLGSIDNLELGNRGYLASKLDSVTRGFRTRQLTEFQRGNLFRMLTAKADVMPEQIDALNEAIIGLARDIRLPPQTIGTVAKLGELPFGLHTKDAIDKVVAKIFGPGDLIGHDGKPVKIDWPNVISKAYRQSFKLNATAGLTSYLKTLGPVGAAASVASDWAYILWRFGLSPVFKFGEIGESDLFNAMRGVFRQDPSTRATFVRGGLGNDGSFLNSEMAFDAMTQAIRGRGEFTPKQRLAASLSLHARHLPEDLELSRTTASVQEIAKERPFRKAEGLDPTRLQDEWQWTPKKAQALVDNSEMVPTSILEPLREIDRRATPEPSLHASLDELGADIEGNGIQAPVIVWWDPSTNRAVVADGNHRLTLALERGIHELPVVVEARSPEEVGQALNLGQLAHPKNPAVPPDGILRPSQVFGEADAELPLPPLAEDPAGLLRQLRETFAKEPPSEEGGLLAELHRIVGGNGIEPGLEQRAKSILDRLDEIERTKGDDGPVLQLADLTPKQQAEWQHRLFDSGDLAGEATPENLQAAFARFQRRPDSANELGDIAGSTEALFDTILPAWAEATGGHGLMSKMRHAGSTVWHPANYKQDRALDLQIDLVERSFPALLKAAGLDGVTEVMRKLGIRDDRWARWMLDDRSLLDQWLNVKGDPAKAPAALAKLLDHAGNDPAEREAFNELYASPEWETLTSLWAINLQATRDEAFGVHFFSPYRSALERGLNHPVLGIYPASWTIKAAREWGKFLFDNRTFGALRLGMAPAQAIAEISRAQAAAFAQTNDDSLDHFMQKGPLGSTIFIFNLMMPGDWSSLPFPLSRSIREVLRGNTDPGKILQANLDFLGATRDVRLMTESMGEIHDLIFGKEKKPVETVLKGLSARGIEDQFGESRR